MKLNISKTTRADIINFYPKRKDALSNHKVIDMIYDIQMFMSVGPTYSLKKDENIIAIFGVAIISRKSGHAWFAGSEDLENLSFKERLRLTKVIKNGLRNIAKVYSLHRIQCDVDAKNKMHSRFAKLMGFKTEGYAPKYYEDGTNAILMGQIYEC